VTREAGELVSPKTAAAQFEQRAQKNCAAVKMRSVILATRGARSQIRRARKFRVHVEGKGRGHMRRNARVRWMLGALWLASSLAVRPARGDLLDPPPPPPGTVVRTWNELAIDAVRIKAQSDAQAARAYAMMNTAMYDAVWGTLSYYNGARTHLVVLPGGAPLAGDLWVAAAAAAHAVLSGLFPDQVARYNTQLAADVAAAPGNFAGKTLGQTWGNLVGNQVLASRWSDGSSPSETQPAGAGPGQFRASWSGVQFRNLQRFAIANPAAYYGAGPPALTSVAYASAFNEVKVVGNAALPDPAKLTQFQFWNLPTGSSQPPGAWLQIAIAVTNGQPLALPDMSRLFALVSLSMVDTVGPTYTTKFTHRHWRPTTAIREADTDGNPNTAQEPSWTARAGSVGSSPEYWSGHSSFSAAAGETLRGFFCKDNIAFSFVSDSSPGGVARSFSSFSAAVTDAGRSRVVGGLHFEFSNREGVQKGRAIAREILGGKCLKKTGPTHSGDCPL
jgi:hypothetical protein